MIPDDVKTRKDEATAKQKQSTLHGHLQDRASTTQPVVKYTDALFRQAAIEWLIETGQVRAALFIS